MNRNIYFFILLFSILSLMSCGIYRTTPVNLPMEPPLAFSQNGKAPLPDKWWTVFEDDTLNALIEDAFERNVTLQAARSRVEQSRALLEKTSAGNWPDVDLPGSWSRQMMETSNGERSYSSKTKLGFSASYEIDLWKRLANSRKASAFDVMAVREDLRAAAMTVSADIADVWINLIERQEQLAILDDQIKTNEDYLIAITLQFRKGQGSALDVLQQRQLLESTRSERIQVLSDISVLRNALAVLTGSQPGTLNIEIPTKMPELPPLPEMGLPVEWLRRRPDMTAAELRILAEDRRLASAFSNQFPKLSFSVTGETSAEKLQNLFDNWLGTLMINLIGPIVDGGERRAEVKRLEAVLQEKMHVYSQTLLTALKDVEDALAMESYQSLYLESLERQLKYSLMSTEQVRSSYIKGGSDFTRYLTTLTIHQRLQRTHLQSQRQLIEIRIGLYKALGGSWSLDRPEENSAQASTSSNNITDVVSTDTSENLSW